MDDAKKGPTVILDPVALQAALEKDLADCKTDTERMITVVNVCTAHLAKNTAAVIRALRDRVAELESSAAGYQGVHETGKAYRKGAFVTHGGSIWAAREATTQRPGDGPQWKLAVKAGKDGRDGAKGDKGDKGDRGRDTL